MKWIATIIVTLFFLSTRTDQNSSWKFYEIVLHQIAPFDLANWTKKVFPVFPRKISYMARPKGPPFQFFSALRDFFRNFFPKGSPFNFFAVLRQKGCLKIPEGPLSVFRHCETFFWKFVFSPKGPPFNCDKNVDNFGSAPLLARQYFF